MKIAVIGGASARTPLLVEALTLSDLPVEEIALFDIDRVRLRQIGGVAAALSPLVRPYDEPRSCVRGASFVFISIRVGGIERRARDEVVAIQHGVVGQETVGAGGFAMAVRSIPHVVAYAHLIAEEAPEAWIVNFTNPVSIVTQALHSSGATRAIGICDTPTELFTDVVHALGLESAHCRFDYFGLNHLGWLRDVYVDGRPQLATLWQDLDLLDRVYRAPLFERAFLRDLGLLPTEYLFYYYRPREAVTNMRNAGRTRGQAIQELDDKLFERLSQPDSDGVRTYREYLDARHAGYMEAEAGPRRSVDPRPLASAPTGYGAIALAVVTAIHANTNAVVPLNVRNDGVLPDLADTDIVEVPCLVNANGASPMHVSPIPASVRPLLTRVKEYERLTISAAMQRSTDLAERALATNPLVDDARVAKELVGALAPLW